MTSREENIQKLCEDEEVANPIDEDVLIHREFVFDLPEGTFNVQPTEMNKAGRLWLQAQFRKQGKKSILILTDETKKEAARFFTSLLWDDCSPEKRPLTWAIKHSSAVVGMPKK